MKISKDKIGGLLHKVDRLIEHYETAMQGSDNPDVEADMLASFYGIQTELSVIKSKPEAEINEAEIEYLNKEYNKVFKN